MRVDYLPWWLSEGAAVFDRNRQRKEVALISRNTHLHFSSNYL